jgi:hypothetical protein
MEKDSLLLQDQSSGMDTSIGDKWTTLKKRGPSRAMLKSYGSQNSISRTCGPQYVISLIIPRLGDKIWIQLGDKGHVSQLHP